LFSECVKGPFLQGVLRYSRLKTWFLGGVFVVNSWCFVVA
jgi:hypothetical protein